MVAALATTGLASTPAPAPVAVATTNEVGHVPGSLLVTVDLPGELQDVLARAVDPTGDVGASDAERLANAVGRVRVEPGHEATAARRLRAVPGVAAVERDVLAHVHRDPDDPWYPKQWAHQRANAAVAWDQSTGSSNVLVAVIDTGMRGDHPDLLPNIAGQVDVSTGAVAGPERTGIDNDSCDQGHGTWVGGVVGAVGDNATDVSGVAWDVALLDVAAASTRPGASCDAIPFSAIIAGIDHAVSSPDRPADVITMSLGAYLDGCPKAMQTAVTQARNRGAVVIASAGNGQADAATAGATAYPAGCGGVISVGATGMTDQRAGYSQKNASVDLVAPGGDYERGGADGTIITTNDAFDVNRLTRVQGTSFAAPYLAGAAALVRSIQPVAGPDEVERVLEQTARDLGPAGRDDAFGHGLVQLDAAVAAAAATLPGVPEPVLPGESDESTRDRAETPAPSDRTVERLGGGTPTRAITTAVSVSRRAFPDGGATHVVLARDDLFADALAGSTLGHGDGPLLYTHSTGRLAGATRQELQRVLPRDGLVYLLGGEQALPGSLEGELDDLGYRAHRLAGQTREDTAVRVATEARQRLRQSGGSPPDDVILATSTAWPDAATAGALGASFGIPIVLTPSDHLAPVTAAFLERSDPRTLYVTGGPVAVSRATASAAAEAGRADVVRLAGSTRIGTALAIAREYDRRHRVRTRKLPRFVLGVNMVRDDAWSLVLAGSALTGQSTGVFVPVDGVGGDEITNDVASYVQDRLRDEDEVYGAVLGGTDVVADGTADRLEQLLRR